MPSHPSDSESGEFQIQARASPPDRGAFGTTHWSAVRLAGGGSTPDGKAALAELCRRYWHPLYGYARRAGCSPEDAEDVTQGFFERLIAKNYLAAANQDRGRFRAFLLASFKHYWSDQRKAAQRQKRGGHCEHINFDAAQAEERYQLESPGSMDADRLFQRRWALTLLEHAFRRLESEMVADGRQKVFARLQLFLIGAPEDSTYAQAASELAMTEGAVKMTVSRLRRRARELIRDEIAQTVTTGAEVDEEYRALLEALRE